MHETGAGQQVAQLHERLMMVMFISYIVIMYFGGQKYLALINFCTLQKKLDLKD